MTDAPDAELLQQFARNASEAAFAELVRRHIALVHSVAMRHTASPQHAQDITQAVFIILARKAGSLGRNTVLPGWLYNTARLTAANLRRSEASRARREQEASFMQSILEKPAPDPAWRELSPLLDDAMSHLGRTDRDALVLRYFQNKTLPEVGAALGMAERTAQKRVTRALEKLRKIFTRRGVTLSAALIAGTVSANSVQAVPVGMAQTVTTVSAVKGAAVGASTLTLIKGTLKLMAWTKAKTAIVVGVGVLLAAGTASVVVSNAGGPSRGARDILDRVFRKYASLSSYSSTGTTTEELGDNRTLTASFSMRLGRPNYYLIEYEQHASGFTNKGAVWADGSGDYFANDLPPPGQVYSASKSPFPGPDGLARNVGMVADISGGTTLVTPALFFGIPIPYVAEQGGWRGMARRMKKLITRSPASEEANRTDLAQPVKWRNMRFVKEPDEKVGEIDCHVLSAETDNGTATLWIGMEDSLVHQSREKFKSRPQDVTDSEVAGLLAGAPGAPPLPIAEIKRRINDGRKKAFATMKPVTVVFSDNNRVSGLKSMTIPAPTFTVFTQTQENIAVNQPFARTDFVHAVPSALAPGK